MANEMVEIVKCPHCKQKEYYGMMHWFRGTQYCRHCIYDIWRERSKWEPGPNDYVFPYYEDGVDYTKDNPS